MPSAFERLPRRHLTDDENEIVEILRGERHVRSYGDYTRWIMSKLVSAFALTRRRRADPPWYRTVRPEIHVRDHVVVPDFAGWYRRSVGRYFVQRFSTRDRSIARTDPPARSSTGSALGSSLRSK